jgi:serine/threonine-protein phosphatase 6 regulatory ankyrin repeat subunit B
MIAAAAQGDLPKLGMLVGLGLNVNVNDLEGFTPLMAAAAASQNDVVKMLLGEGADTEKTDVHGMTALMFAAAGARLHCAETLIDGGANLNARTSDSYEPFRNWSALMHAARNGHNALVELLLKHGALTEVTDEEGETSLMKAAASGHLTVVRTLLDAGASVGVRNRDGKSARDLALELGFTELANALRQPA